MNNMNFNFLVFGLSLFLLMGCGGRSNQQIVRNSCSQKENLALGSSLNTDSVFYFYERAKLLPESCRAVRIIEVMDSSAIGSLDFYASDIQGVFSNSRIEEITPVLLYYVDYLLSACIEKSETLLSEEFERMPESAQRAAVQSEMHYRESLLRRSKNILEAVLSTNTEHRPQALLLYGNVLYNLGDYEDEVENVYAEYYKMMQEKGLTDEVPEYVTDPAERRIIGEDW